MGMVIFSHSYGLCAWSSLSTGRQGREVRMYQKTRGTSTRLMPQDPREIIQCMVVACLVAAAIVGIPQLISMAMQAWS